MSCSSSPSDVLLEIKTTSIAKFSYWPVTQGSDGMLTQRKSRRPRKEKKDQTRKEKKKKKGKPEEEAIRAEARWEDRAQRQDEAANREENNQHCRNKKWPQTQGHFFCLLIMKN